mmetsp:Transcript_11478/g.24790  ORF Transcript_11478/g.24790 Transcript_11478/m.24790 type:complete len:228 (+) Transcript_11478:269-952(+)
MAMDEIASVVRTCVSYKLLENMRSPNIVCPFRAEPATLLVELCLETKVACGRPKYTQRCRTKRQRSRCTHPMLLHCMMYKALRVCLFFNLLDVRFSIRMEVKLLYGCWKCHVHQLARHQHAFVVKTSLPFALTEPHAVIILKRLKIELPEKHGVLAQAHHKAVLFLILNFHLQKVKQALLLHQPLTHVNFVSKFHEAFKCALFVHVPVVLGIEPRALWLFEFDHSKR